MKKAIIITTAFAIASCEGNRKPPHVAGTYVRSFPVEQRNIQTGKTVGISQFRDTVYIVEKEQGFQVQQKKWRNNDYDNDGWQQQTAISGVRQSYQARFDETDNTLISENGVYSPILVDMDGKQIFLNDKKDSPYKKVE